MKPSTLKAISTLEEVRPEDLEAAQRQIDKAAKRRAWVEKSMDIRATARHARSCIPHEGQQTSTVRKLIDGVNGLEHLADLYQFSDHYYLNDPHAGSGGDVLPKRAGDFR